MRWKLGVFLVSRRGVRGIPRRDHDDLSLRRSLNVAVIGAPNVGKSLVTNQLVRAAVSAVSSKMDTTTKNVCAALSEDDIQLIVVDSPGTVGITHARKVMGLSKGDDGILDDPEYALTKADHVLVVQDATAPGDYIHHRVIHLLHRHSHIPSSLVINKIDLVHDRSELLELTRILTKGKVDGKEIKTVQSTIGRLGKANDSIKLHDEELEKKDEKWQQMYRSVIATPASRVGFATTKQLFMNERGWASFGAVFFVSALTSEGIEGLRDHLKELSIHREWRMDESALTTMKPHVICEQSVRAALLDTLPSDVAYRLRPKVTEWKEEGEVLQVVVDIECEKERIARLLVGKGGSKVVEIGRRVNDHMASLFQRQLFVRILIKHKGQVYNS